MDVGDRGEEVVHGIRVHIGEGVADGDCCDLDAWIEGDHVSVEPGLCHGAVLGDGGDHVVGNCEEEGGVAVEEAAGDGGVDVFEVEGSCVEVTEPGDDALRGGGRVLRGGGGGEVGDAEVWLGEEGERGSRTGAPTSLVFFLFLIIFKIN